MTWTRGPERDVAAGEWFTVAGDAGYDDWDGRSRGLA